MKHSHKNRITLKVLVGYFILGILATIAGFLILSEIKTFTKLQRQDILDKNKVLETGSLIANIYKNESLARAALQLNSSKKFNKYLNENEKLILKIDSLNLISFDTKQEFILDSIKFIIDKKLKNITDLKKLKLNDNSEESINSAINKLGSVESLLGNVTLEDLVENPNTLNVKSRKKFEDYVIMLNKNTPRDSISDIEQRQIDSLLSVSRKILREAQIAATIKRKSLQKKEREIIESDLIISRKLQELLTNLEIDIYHYASDINKQRDKTLNRSKNIIFFAAVISFIIIILFSIVILNDFWKSQQYRKQLEEANKNTSALLKSREQLISMVSHDLRTPLSTISGFSELLQKSIKDSKNYNYVDHIKSASDYMYQLVDDLLEFSKLENGSINVESISFNLDKHIDEIIQNTKNIVIDKPIKFVVKHDKSINKNIISDPFRIKQILYNLIINAYKFTEKGKITVETSLKQNTNSNILEISITDTGIGISKNQKESIFNAFSQAESNKNNTQKGFGLGLTISKKLAELLNGNLSLKSELNKGSTFTLKLPVILTDRTDESKIKEPKKDKPTFNLKAIIVEDDAPMRLLIQNLLKQYGIKSYVFDNAQTALNAVSDIEFDFVLTDIQLPKMNGILFMETLKHHPTYKKQPIIAMTGRANMTKEDYIKNGFSEILIKPFSSEKIQDVLTVFFKIKNKTSNNINPLNNKNINEKGFNINALRLFLNNDPIAIKSTLQTFLKDTKKNFSLLKKVGKNNDVKTINDVSHKMLSMFRQLEVKTIIPFLEEFETTKKIDSQNFIEFKNNMTHFIFSLETYLS